MKTKEEKQQAKHFLNLAGEYGVCSELQKRGVYANTVYGNKKATDIIIVKDKRAFTIEVKTSMENKIVTSFFQKYITPEHTPRPDFWVIVHIDKKTLSTDFYVFTHEEMAKAQMSRNNMTEWYVSEGRKKGVCSILVPQIQQYKNKWETIINIVGK